MPDLRDGESVTMQGSGSRPYVLKNVGGVYSCTCPAFDAPAATGGFEERLEFVRRCMDERRPPYARRHDHAVCGGVRHLNDELNRVTALGGEGLMLRRPGSLYEAGRSRILLKVKRCHDAEALVVGHDPGAGRHKGRLGALLVQTAEGVRFAVGTGFSDKQREEPPPIGATITFRYQELSDRGVPRFPVFAGICVDAERSLFTEKGGTTMAVSSIAPRRFEFSEGSSHKFWEIQTRGVEVTVRFGRIGAEGQVQVKSFTNAEEAAQHVEKMVREKSGKGYREVS